MNTATVGNGKAIHYTADDSVTLCGKAYDAESNETEATCKACLKAATALKEETPSAEAKTTDVEVAKLNVGDVVRLSTGDEWTVSQVGPVMFGHVKISFEGRSHVIKYRADFVLTKVG